MKKNKYYTLKEVVDQADYIYSLMYSPNRVYKDEPIEKEIIKISTKDLRWYNPNSFEFAWGWPGPDYNIYTIETYGKGWAFTLKEIKEAWNE